MKTLRVILFLSCIGIVIVSCGKKAIIRKYYVIESDSQITPQSLNLDKPLPFMVDVRDFRIAKAFDQTRIAIRSESHELNYYFYHHWAVRPTDAVSDLVFDTIYRSGIFSACSREYSPNADFYITGFIHAIELLQTKKKLSAHVHLRFQLIESKSELEELQHEIEQTKELEGEKTMNLFAGAVSEIIREGTEVFITKIADHFKTIESQ